MGLFRIEHPSGVVEHVDKSDCDTPDACASSMFGMVLADVEKFGSKIIQLTEEEFAKVMSFIGGDPDAASAPVESPPAGNAEIGQESAAPDAPTQPSSSETSTSEQSELALPEKAGDTNEKVL